MLLPKVEANEWLPQQALVADLMTNQIAWNTSLIWKSFSADDARNILATHIPKEELEDVLCWSGSKNGRYSFKSGYWFMENDENPRPSNVAKSWIFPRRKCSLFPRWKYFVWRIMHRALPTKKNLRKRGVEVVSSVWCVGVGLKPNLISSETAQ